MLQFLYLAAKRGFVVDSYRDTAVGVLAKDSAGKLAMTRVTLRPEVRFVSDKRPTPEEALALHHQAHEECFIANSVRTEVRCEPVAESSG
jgi:organic hydroperoxide reductase OsmC/OhrA